MVINKDQMDAIEKFSEGLISCFKASGNMDAVKIVALHRTLTELAFDEYGKNLESHCIK